MLTYILDALRQREGALGTVWITLGLTNLAMWLAGGVFAAGRPFVLGLMIAACTGVTLFMTGDWLIIGIVTDDRIAIKHQFIGYFAI